MSVPLDPLLSQPTRLQIVALLFRNRQASAKSVCAALDITPGNLASHAARLEEAGYVETFRALAALQFEVRHRITPRGDAAFRAHAAALQELLASSLAAQKSAQLEAP
ncbi:MAG TPA: winged helix-turn-helix domain-containing protein [Candidatus Thermoplasmatota archaeon]|nr:winged helix-turn-helix domain-containing protein [Candidatus Thermoplasmatota archaeon]